MCKFIISLSFDYKASGHLESVELAAELFGSVGTCFVRSSFYYPAITLADFQLVKAVLMFTVVYIVKDSPFMTIGDAVASFLDERDTATSRIGLLSIYDARKGYHAVETTWVGPTRRWKDATSRKRRVFTLTLYSLRVPIVSYPSC